MKKKKVLFINETSFLPTGLARYGKEILLRLYASNKYELAEFGYYGEPEDPRIASIPWTYFNNKPSDKDVVAMQRYNSKVTYQFGEYNFENILLKFQPDIILTASDYWYSEFIERSPHRRFFKWINLPTVDSIPQHENWLSAYKNCDVVIPYTKFAQKALLSESGKLINVFGDISYAGVEHDIFYPMDKTEVRGEFGIDDDAIIIGTCMRNQARKLYPELMEAFSKYLKVAPKELSKKSFLYIHSTYPDLGYDFPHLIKKYGLSSKILFTYACRSCGAVFPCFFRDIRTNCEKCKQPTAYFPNTQQGISRENLAKVINTFTVGVQYSNSEGFGLPMIEIASCGIPIFATDYSAMSEIANLIGYKIKVASYKMDVDFNTERATLDADDFILKLINYLQKPLSAKIYQSEKIRNIVVKTFCWDKTAKVWQDAIDSVNISGYEYNESPALHNPVMPTEPFEDNTDFVRWAIINILGKPEMVCSYMAMRLVRDLNSGCTPVGIAGATYHNENSGLGLNHNHENFNPEILINKLIQMRTEINSSESKRYATVNRPR